MTPAAVSSDLAPAVARRLGRLSLDDVPADVLAAAKLHVLDALGVALAAAAARPELARGLGRFGTGTSTVIGHAARLAAPDAALMNGMLTHSLEFDDTHVASVIHGSAVVVPAALAVGEREGASGADLLAAVIAGWELLIRLGLASPGRFQAAGFQTVAVAGPFASAVVAARLSGSGSGVLADALGIAGSQASGTFEFLADASSVKAMHPGWAAHSGILAVDLARMGVTGPHSVFGGRFGFFRTFAGDDEGAARLEALLEDVGTRWLLPEAAFKLYPCCHYIHSFLECAEQLVRDGLRPQEIGEITLRVPVEEAPIVCDPWARKQEPVSDYDARFSLPVCLAAMLQRGSLDAAGFAGLARDPDVLALARRMRHEPWEGSGFPARFPAAMEVVTTDGRTLTAAVDEVRGGAARPLSADDVRAKFRANAAPLLGARRAEELVGRIDALESGTARAVGALLRPDAAAQRDHETEAG